MYGVYFDCYLCGVWVFLVYEVLCEFLVIFIRIIMLLEMNYFICYFL